MACFKPINAYRTATGVCFQELRRHGDIIGRIDLPCGQCVGCRLERSRAWASRIMHEASLHDQNCFVTLTYDEANLPENNSLFYPHIQLFLKRLRKHFKHPIRYYLCGEYGEGTQRPHYHLCLFNLSFSDQTKFYSPNSSTYFASPTLTKLWPHGQHTIGDLTLQSAAYTARYIMQKITGDLAKSHYTTVDSDGVMHSRVPEFNRMSLRPGIGRNWYDKYGDRDVAIFDQVIADGHATKPPRYYDKLRKRADQAGFEDAQFKRSQKGRKHHANNTPERLAVREAVATARLSQLTRKL